MKWFIGILAGIIAAFLVAFLIIFSKSVYGRVAVVETRIAVVETRISDVETRLSGVETRLAVVETRLAVLETKIDKMFEILTDLRVEFARFGRPRHLASSQRRNRRLSAEAPGDTGIPDPNAPATAGREKTLSE
ncbi:MAG: hypothetical protein LBQ79_02945 [Deltaproteobacteria bacterium]|nr:hypothetical protein [Deltaproteobacteria bacterium]